MTCNAVYGDFYHYAGVSAPADVITSYLSGDAEFSELCVLSGAHDDMVSDYIDAVNSALPDGIVLAGSEFIGPADDRYDRSVHALIREAIDSADVDAIVQRHGRKVPTLPEGEWDAKQVAEHLGLSSPGSARKTLSRWGIRACEYVNVWSIRACEHVNVDRKVVGRRVIALYPAKQVALENLRNRGRV
jgi:hypothetical protein